MYDVCVKLEQLYASVHEMPHAHDSKFADPSAQFVCLVSIGDLPYHLFAFFVHASTPDIAQFRTT